MNTNPNQNKMTFTPEELDNILTLIDFHDDFEEVKEIWGFDIETLRNKVSDLLTNSNSKLHSLKHLLQQTMFLMKRTLMKVAMSKLTQIT